jgi:hypothetical protein
MPLFDKCKHEWEVIVNDYEKSFAQKLIEKFDSVKGGEMPLSSLIGKKIIILQCKKCGELNKTIEEI